MTLAGKSLLKTVRVIDPAAKWGFPDPYSGDKKFNSHPSPRLKNTEKISFS